MLRTAAQLLDQLQPEGDLARRPLAEGKSADLHPVDDRVVCDHPLCVRADGTLLDRLEGSTQAACRGSRNGSPEVRWGYRGLMLGCEAMYRRSLAPGRRVVIRS